MSYNPDADLYEAAEEQADDDQYSSNLASSVEDVDATADSYGDTDAGESVSESLNDPTYDWGSSGGGSFGSYGPASDPDVLDQSEKQEIADSVVGIDAEDVGDDGSYELPEWQREEPEPTDFETVEKPDPWEPPEGLDDVEVTADSYDDLDDADHDGATSDTTETTSNDTTQTADDEEDSEMSEWEPPEGLHDVEVTAESYGDFDAGGMEGVDGEVTYTIDQYGEAYIGEDDEGNEQLMAPEGFELDSDQQQALSNLLSAGEEPPENVETQGPPEWLAAYEQRLSELAGQVGGTSSGSSGLDTRTIAGGVALIAVATYGARRAGVV